MLEINETILINDKDWRLELITDKSLIKFTYDIKRMINHLLLSMTEKSFMEIFHRIENYFPFETLFKKAQDEKIIEIFFQIFNKLLGEKKPFMNAEVSNFVHVCFDLNLPFFLNEIEIVNRNNEFKQEINKLNRFGSISDNHIYESIFKEILDEEYLIDLYLTDLVTYYMNDLLIGDRNCVKYLIKLIKDVIATKKEIYNVENAFRFTFKLKDILKKLIDTLNKFKDELDENTQRDILLKLISIGVNKNSDYNDDYLQKTLFDSLINEILDQLITKGQKLNINCFKNLFIEVMNIESKYSVKVRTYESCFFLNELSKLNSNLISYTSVNNENNLVSTICKIVKGKIHDNQFLFEIDCIDKILYDINLRNTGEDKNHFEKFESTCFSLFFELNNDINKLSAFLDRFFKNKNSIRIAGSLFSKIMKSFKFDISLGFLIKEDENNLPNYVYLEVLDKKFKEIGLESDFAFLFCDSLQKIIKKDIDQIFIVSNKENLYSLFEVLKSYSDDIQNELINKIKYKNIAYLTSLAYLKLAMLTYCDFCYQENKIPCKTDQSFFGVFNVFYFAPILGKLVGYNNGENHKINYSEIDEFFNSILCDVSKLSNSLRILILRIIYLDVGSISKLKENLTRFKWRNIIEIPKPKCLLDIKLTNKICTNETQDNDQKILDLIKTNLENKISIIDYKERLAWLLSLINSFYFLNSYSEFHAYSVKQELFFNNSEYSSENTYFSELFKNLIKNFSNNQHLRITPKIDIEEFKLISVIMHCASIDCALNNSLNPFFSLFFDLNGKKIENVSSKNNLFWICSKDNEEFKILNAIKYQNFVDEGGNGGVALYSRLNFTNNNFFISIN